jgi:hypothetical protein
MTYFLGMFPVFETKKVTGLPENTNKKFVFFYSSINFRTYQSAALPENIKNLSIQPLMFPK